MAVSALLASAALVPAATVVNVNMVRGFVTVRINDRTVGTFGKKGAFDRGGNPIATVDVSRRVRPGDNRMTVEWSGARPIGEVRVSESIGGRFRVVGEIRLDVLGSGRSRSVDFRVGGAAGGGGLAPARPGSADRQALLTANLTRGNVVAFVNGRRVGSYGPGVVPLDISDYARRGENTLRLTWRGPRPLGSLRVSYAAKASAFRTVAQYDLNVFARSNSGGTVTFRLP